MYQKLMLNRLKIMGNPTSIYTNWACNSMKFFKKHPITCAPMCIMCGPCAPMSEL
jgi:hypothetical protein